MDSSDNKYDVNSKSTIVLWKNDKSPDEYSITNKSHQELKTCNSYKVPQRLSENYLYLIRKTANELVNRTIADSEWITWCSFKSYNNTNRPALSMSDDENKNKVTHANHIKKCKDTLFSASSSSHSLMSETGWLGENRIFNDHAATLKISDYIKHNWNLDAKFLFTIENMDKSNNFCSTSHRYRVEFSVPTKTCVIPQITVSAFFTVEYTYLLSLPVYMKYHLETDRRVYVVGQDRFNKERFLQLFKMKRDAFIKINNYPEWSYEPCQRLLYVRD